jgi:hypothetical protein
MDYDQRVRAMRQELLAVYDTYPDLKQCFNLLAKKHHPDRDGDSENFKALQDAHTQLKAELDRGADIGAGFQREENVALSPRDANRFRLSAQQIREGKLI